MRAFLQIDLLMLVLWAGISAHANPDWLVVQQVEMIPKGYLPVDVGAWLEGGEVACAEPIASQQLRFDSEPPALSVDFEALIAAHEGDHLVYVVSSAAADAKAWRWQLVHRRLSTGTEQTIDLGEWQPTSLHVRGQNVYLGAAECEYGRYDAKPKQIAVGRIDLDAESPSLEIVTRRRDPVHLSKMYDLMISEGDFLIAVDDIVEPFFADSFRIESKGALTHLAGWELPSLVNGHYKYGLLQHPDSASPTLCLATSFSVSDGSGFNLFSLPLQPRDLSYPKSKSYGRDLDDLERAGKLLEEKTPRGPGEPSLLAGSTFTPWLGLARLNDHLVVAAGERGLLVIPADFTSTTRATLVDLGEPCIDVVSRNNALIALTGHVPQRFRPIPGNQPSTLHLLRDQELGIQSVSSFRLPGKNYRRLLK